MPCFFRIACGGLAGGTDSQAEFVGTDGGSVGVGWGGDGVEGLRFSAVG